MTAFSQIIRSERLKSKYTREQLATLLAISLQEYSDIEEGRSKPSNQFLKDMTDFYGLNIADLKKSLRQGLRLVDEQEEK